MNPKVIIAIVLVAIIGVGAYLVWDNESRVDYDVSEPVGALGVVSFTVSATLDDDMTVSAWYDGGRQSMGDADVWAAPAGEWSMLFMLPLPDGVTAEEYLDGFELRFDGKAGIMHRA